MCATLINMKDCVLAQTTWNTFNTVITEVGVGPRIYISVYSNSERVTITQQYCKASYCFWSFGGNQGLEGIWEL